MTTYDSGYCVYVRKIKQELGMIFRVKVLITYKSGIPNPEANDVKRKIGAMGIDVADVQIGKYFELEVDATSEENARKMMGDMCLQLLANQYSEQHEIVSVLPG